MSRDLAQQMWTLYERGYTGKQIATMFGYATAKSVYDKLDQAGFSRRSSAEKHDIRRKYNPDFMGQIDVEWKGYFLGLMLTDGWVLDDQSVGLQLVDKEVLEMLSGFIGQPFKTIPARQKQHQTAYRIYMKSEKLASDLRRFGIVPRKTYGMPRAELHISELKYLTYIIRGVIDGDGTFGFPSNSPTNPYCRIVEKVPDLLIQVQEWCEILGMRNIKLDQRNNQYHLYIGGAQNMNIIKASIYTHPFGMTRKRKLLLEGRSTSQEVDDNPVYAGTSLEPDLLASSSKNDQDWTIRREASQEEPSETAIRTALGAEGTVQPTTSLDGSGN